MSTLTPERCVVRNTAATKGRTRAVAPGCTASRYLYYGRIVLDASETLSFKTGDHETGFVCLKGRATIAAEGETHTLVPFDALYVPRDATVEIEAGPPACDLAEISAPVSRRHPVQFVSYEAIQSDPGLHFKAGGPSNQRVLNVLIGKNVQASRIMAGVTFSQPGNWTSWPPHEHAAMLEEAISTSTCRRQPLAFNWCIRIRTCRSWRSSCTKATAS